MARNAYEEITNKIVAALEAGAGNYEQPWSNLCKGTLPRNVASGKAYRGVNVLSLWASGGAGWWGTYQQWQAIGGQVRKGEKSSIVVFYQPATKRTKKDGEDETFLLMKYYSVFSLDQVDALPNEDGTPGTIVIPHAASLPESREERIAEAEAFFAQIPATVNHGGDRAFYRPATDNIQMPDFRQFAEAEAYYSTLSHELVHWSGAEARLDRNLKGRFGDEAYAMEELIAELGAAFTMGLTGLSTEPRVDHAQYLSSWLKVLKKDSKAIFTVASRAQAAAEYLAAYAGAAEEPVALAA